VTNRERLLRTNPYDMLVDMQIILLKFHTEHFCILGILGAVVECRNECSKCIEEWLNQEVV
jgi:hypothetical protein